MNIGVVGLGLIGGSLARALKGLENVKVLGYDINESTVLQSKLFGVTDEVLSEKNMGECDYIFVALYPKATEKFLEDNLKYILALMNNKVTSAFRYAEEMVNIITIYNEDEIPEL